jgi:hypothetical protein
MNELNKNLGSTLENANNYLRSLLIQSGSELKTSIMEQALAIENNVSQKFINLNDLSK